MADPFAEPMLFGRAAGEVFVDGRPVPFELWELDPYRERTLAAVLDAIAKDIRVRSWSTRERKIVWRTD
jgi:hypothetical protein